MRDKFGQFLMAWRIRAVLPHLRGRVMDLGCGTNQLLDAYRRTGRGEGVGVDVAPWPEADLVVADTARLPFPDSHFDAIACMGAINHIPDRVPVLKEAARVLKPGGQLVVTVLPPRLSGLWHRLRSPWDADQNERGMKPGEVYGFTHRDFLALVDQGGLEVVAMRRFMLGINRLYLCAHRSAPRP